MPEAIAKLDDMVPAPIELLLGVVLLLIGGHWLVDGSVSIARRVGVSTLLIGMTVVAFGTSSPELAFNIAAAIGGNGELSFGNVVGSNIANIGLVLGTAAIIGGLAVHSRVLRRELPLLIVVSAAMLVLPWTPIARGRTHDYTRVDGLVLLLGFTFVSWLWYRLAKSDRSDSFAREIEGEVPSETRSLPVALGLFLAGLVALMAGGQLSKFGAVGIAESLGASEALIGLTIVAIATSLPELVTTVVAVRKGHADLALGNVVGSNLFNILLVLGVTAVCAPVSVPTGGWWDLTIMLAFTVALVPILYTRKRRITRWEGTFLVVCYVAYMVYRVATDPGATGAV